MICGDSFQYIDMLNPVLYNDAKEIGKRHFVLIGGKIMESKWHRRAGALLCACCLGVFGGNVPLKTAAEPVQLAAWSLPKTFKQEQGKRAVELSSAADLEKLRSDPGGSYVLTQDIVVNGKFFQTFDTFSGTLDGGGHWVRGLRLDTDGKQVINGLFGTIEKGAEVKNLGLAVSAEITGQLPTHISGFAGTMNGKMTNCVVESIVSGGTEYGPVAGGSGIIENCTMRTTAENVEKLSGFVTENNCKLRSSQAEIQAQGCPSVYGLTCRNWEEVTLCSVVAAAQDVDTFYCATGQNYGPIRKCSFQAELAASYGKKPQWYSVKYEGDNGSFDSSNVVDVRQGSGSSVSSFGGAPAGKGTQASPYQLRTLDDLELLRTYPDACFVLEADIDGGGADFSAIGEFSGTLDGNGHTIRNLYYKFEKAESGRAAALIRNVKKGGVVENLTIECSMDAGKQESTDAAGITICNEGTVRDCTVTLQAKNCYALGGITRNNTGSGKIENCTTTVSTDNCRFVAGIAEYQAGTVRNCDAVLQVTNATCLGGIAYANLGTIRNCRASGRVDTVYTNGYLASLVGENLSGGTVTSSTGSIINAKTQKWLSAIGNENQE